MRGREASWCKYRNDAAHTARHEHDRPIGPIYPPWPWQSCALSFFGSSPIHLHQHQQLSESYATYCRSKGEVEDKQ